MITNAWWIIFVGALAGMFAGYCLIAPILLCLCGFGCGGVKKGSFAAARQSAIGNVEEGSCFADAQSEGAGGCCSPHCWNIFCLIVFGVTGGLVGAYVNFH
eukprot:scpid102051/ scgid34119/ 